MAEINSFLKVGILGNKKPQGLNRTVASVPDIYTTDNTVSNPFPRGGKKNPVSKVLMILYAIFPVELLEPFFTRGIR